MATKTWKSADLLKLAGGYWDVCALHAAVKLDIFTPLEESKLTSLELAGILQTDPHGLVMLLNALVALGLLEKNGDCYESTSFSREFLSRSSSKYLGYIILHHHNLISSWTRLDEAVRNGVPDRERVSKSNDEAVRENFEMGMFNLAMEIAPQLVPHIDLTGRRKLLDLGGGPGTYAAHFCLNNPELEAVVYDLPTTRQFAEKTIALFGLSNRITFQAGDFIAGDIKGHFDVAWLSHILHGAGQERSTEIVAKAVSSLDPGGVIMIQEFILQDDMCNPLYPALFSLNMLLGTPAGRSFSQGEIMSMLTAAGAKDVRRLAIELPNGAGVILGAVP